MVSYDFDEELGILKFHFIGQITIKDLFENALTIVQNDALPRDVKLLAYADKADFVFSTEELDGFWKALAAGKRKFTSVKEAIIVARPKETALTYISSKSARQMDHFKFSVFSTEAAALAWLLE